MANYAMICNNEVIEVLYDLDEAPIWPPDGAGNLVTSVECSEEATRDWRYNPETGEVFEPIYVPSKEPEVFVDESEYEQYYNMVNAAILGGE